MPLICTNCDNKEKFRREVYGRCDYTETQYIDSNGDVDDTENIDYQNYDEDGDEGTSCQNCGRMTAIEVEEEDWENWTGPGSVNLTPYVYPSPINTTSQISVKETDLSKLRVLKLKLTAVKQNGNIQ